MRKITLSLTLVSAFLLTGCMGNELTYGNRTFRPSPEGRAQMLADKEAVKAAEREERAERRAEFKEQMMDIVDVRDADRMSAAKAYRTATQGKKGVRCYHTYYGERCY